MPFVAAQAICCWDGREDLALHPTVKPIALVADAIQHVTRGGDAVLDISPGSGKTLIAVERTGDGYAGSSSILPVSILRFSAGRR